VFSVALRRRLGGRNLLDERGKEKYSSDPDGDLLDEEAILQRRTRSSLNLHKRVEKKRK